MLGAISPINSSFNFCNTKIFLLRLNEKGYKYLRNEGFIKVLAERTSKAQTNITEVRDNRKDSRSKC